MSIKKTEADIIDRLFYEKKAASRGYSAVAGIDEAGRGPLAGPVVAAAVVMRDTGFTEKIDDSKKLSPAKRERAYIDILRRCDVGIGVADVGVIDDINIFNATVSAMRKAVEELKDPPDYLLIDGNMPLDLPQERTCLVRGEELSLSVACASIIAKVFRDRMMLEEDKKYPLYGFAGHKGYGTRAHMDAIRKYGLSEIHRKSFGPFGGRVKARR